MPTILTLRTPSPALPIPRIALRAPRAQGPALLDDANRALLRLVETLELWGARFAQRRTLGGLSDEMLHDIGRSRADAEAEASKPFWQA